jgi:hypothetical protein
MTPKELEHFKNCEAKEWLRRYQAKKLTIGSSKALLWWQGVLKDLERIRGESDTLDLRERMNRIQNEIRSKG